MSRIADDQNTGSSSLDVVYAPVVAEMRQVEDILRREMRSDHPFVDALVRYGCLLGGKRLRPALLLLSAKASGRLTENHLTLAAVVEMVHTATLVHDDVLDGASMRRHLATVNARWDDEASVLLGDFLFSHAFYMASTLGSTLACRLIGRSTNIVCEGEICQKGTRADFSLSEARYFEILDAKTAELCACCCRLGAHFASTSESVTKQLTMYGRYLGIAFQIADDLLDIHGDEETTGKSLGTDLVKQKPTLPVIRALQLVDPEQRVELLSLLSDQQNGRAEALRAYFDQYDVVAYTKTRAREYANLALGQLNGLETSPAEQSLRMLAEFVVNRVN